MKIIEFFATQNLREINFRDSRISKLVILTHLKLELFAFFKGWNLPKLQFFRAPKIARMAVLELLDLH